MSVGVQEVRAERLRHASAAIVRGAAADAEDDVATARVERVEQQFANAACGGAQWVALVGGEQRQPGGGGHLDDGHWRGGLCPGGFARAK
jgi:hypothetical protein